MTDSTFDFSGWATKNDIRCSDGRTIRHNAFADNDGDVVPLVWQHGHNDTNNVLGHVRLENRAEGVYAYGYFNDTPAANNARELLKHGDVDSMSIYANNLTQSGGDVKHGNIVEVSLVLSGANPGAKIENIALAHGDGTYETTDEAYIMTGEHLAHAETPEKPAEKPAEKTEGTSEGKTIKDIVDSMNNDQKEVLYFLIAKAAEGEMKPENSEPNKEGAPVAHSNIFENDGTPNEGDTLYHSTIDNAFKDAVRTKANSMRDVFMSIAESNGLSHADIAHAEKTYGISNIDLLFPDAKNLDVPPAFIDRDQSWVKPVLNGTHHTPFTRIKSMQADITADEARAKGYITGSRKKEEVFKLLKRTTGPTTIYKKQKFDRDDLLDITDFDVIAWVKQEMRMKLDEELARAILIGDGRSNSDPDKINEENIRPILKEDDLYCIKKDLGTKTTADIIDELIRAQDDLEGTGTPTLFCAKSFVTDMLLLKDTTGHYLYPTKQALADRLGVTAIVDVPQMKGLKTGAANDKDVLAIIVNLSDYNVGTDKGGEVTMFDDFDIDFNQQKYLLETRVSGALTKVKSAMVVTGTAAPSAHL
jgi:HK97 family phage prohead protease